jgi:hypothetical protein
VTSQTACTGLSRFSKKYKLQYRHLSKKWQQAFLIQFLGFDFLLKFRTFFRLFSSFFWLTFLAFFDAFGAFYSTDLVVGWLAGGLGCLHGGGAQVKCPSECCRFSDVDSRQALT